MSTLGSFICIRNGFELDYSFELAAASLLKVCDQLVLCDSDSTDGTKQALQRMADREPRIKVINWPWPNPKGRSHFWFIEWLNFARQHLTTDFCLYLDADEVLSDSPECHAAIRAAMEARKCLAVDRLNFWRDAASLIPDGECCGKWCVRFGPREYECVSDEPHHAGERPIVDEAVKEPAIKIFHLGFLREQKAFYRKARVVLTSWFNRYDPRLEAGEKDGKPVWETECDYTDRLTPFTGYMPDAVQRWLADRGHNTERYVARIKTPPDPIIEIAEPPPAHEPLNILHYGDYGDALYLLAICQPLHKVRLYFSDRNDICKRILERLHILAPLLESQPYVETAKPHEGEPIHWNAGEFRVHHELTRSLAWAHAQHYAGQGNLPQIAPDLRSAWITAKADPRAQGRIVINRTRRYPNRHFKWREIVQHYGDTLMFIGTPEEHHTFCDQHGTVPYQPTADLLEAAQLIAGSTLFIGNQSACFAIAEGMKHPRLLEVCLDQPDVIVAEDPKLHLSADGGINLPALVGKAALELPPGITKVNYLRNPSDQPRTGWKCGKYADVSYGTLKRRMMGEIPGLTAEQAHKDIFDALAAREPSYFANGQQHAELAKFKEALINAR